MVWGPLGGKTEINYYSFHIMGMPNHSHLNPFICLPLTYELGLSH